MERVTDMQGWMRDVQRRIVHLERRRTAAPAAGRAVDGPSPGVPEEGAFRGVVPADRTTTGVQWAPSSFSEAAGSGVEVSGGTLVVQRSGVWVFGAVGRFGRAVRWGEQRCVGVEAAGRKWFQHLGAGERHFGCVGVQHLERGDSLALLVYQDSGGDVTVGPTLVSAKWLGGMSAAATSMLTTNGSEDHGAADDS